MTHADKLKATKILEKAIELLHLSDRDEMVYGNSYFEITERGIKLLEPSEVIMDVKTSELKKLKDTLGEE